MMMNPTRFLGLGLLLLACTAPVAIRSGISGADKLANPSPSRPSLAMNLSGPADWNTELPFVDLFHFTREWISQQEGKGWGQGPKLAIDERGWVKALAPGCFAENFLTSFDSHYPAGDYVVLYDGEGQLTFGACASVKSAVKGRMVLTVDPKRSPFSIQIRKINPANPLKNIRVLLPGSEATYKSNPFNPDFLNRWRGVSAFRFMDWMQTNNSKIKSWADRPRVDDASWAPKGIPLEIMAQLCNELKVDGWFCMPHLATDDYMQNFATQLSKLLDPGLRAYVEFSNEVWNGQFEQQRYAGDLGLKAGIGDSHWGAAWHWYARRSGQMFDIWSRAFSKERLVRVLASQAGNSFVSEQILGFEGAGTKADVLAIAPYFGFSVPQSGDPSADAVAQWSQERLFKHLKEKVIPETVGWIRDHKKVADKYGVGLVAYEGGQHLTGVAGGENNDKLTKLFTDANRDPRMGQLYTQYLEAWKGTGGGLFANFSSVSTFSKWGSWGLLEYADDPILAAPKYRAVTKWGQSLGQRVGSR